MVDRVVEYEPAQYIRTIKLVTINEPYFTGHFPQEPIMPGVMIAEAMGQSAGLLFEAFSGYMVAMNNVKFSQFIRPGDVLEIEAHAQERWGTFVKARARGYVAGQEVCRGEFTLQILK
jgi:3-hydroxyacyl-[acyl-carrier-protein] dehydratase